MRLASLRQRIGSATIEVGVHPGNIVRLQGVLREQAHQRDLPAVLEAVHLDAVRLGVHEIVLDLRELSYASADFWRSLVLWLRWMQAPPVARYKLRILANPSHNWQSIGMSTLSVFGGKHLAVESSVAGAS